MTLEKGSYWRKWDLHIHTRTSYDYEIKESEYSDEELVQKWIELEFAAVAITDHFKIDMDRIKNLRTLCQKNNITLFPGIELRTSQGDKNVHIIGIFPEDIDIEELYGRFKFDFIKKAHSPESDDTIYWDLKEIERFIRENKGIISVHAGNKASGIDKTMGNDSFFRGVKEEYAKIVDIFEVNNKHSYEGYKESVIQYLQTKYNKNFPVIISSDNHNYRNYELSSYLWIKADPTFEGLKQALLHPDERIYVGDKPPKLINLENNPRVIIESIDIKKNKDSDGTPNWFNQEILFNPSLVAIIGNKGSGKSALTDILGTLTKSIQYEHLSFLTKERFNKNPHQYGKDFSATLTWNDGQQEIVENLFLESSEFQQHLSHAQYLPQTYIERTCSDIENSFFQTEINKVIFSYIPTEERLGTNNFNQYIEKKTRPIQLELDKLKIELKEVNSQIIKLESKKTLAYKKEITEKLAEKVSQYERHLKSKPQEIIKPTDEESLVYDREIQDHRNQLESLNDQLKFSKEELSKKSIEHQNLLNIKSKMDNVESEITNFNKYVKDTLGIENEEATIKVILPADFYMEKISEINNLINIVSDKIKEIQTNIEIVNNNIAQLAEKTSLKNREYQEYLNRLNTWQINLESIIGSEHTIDSLENLKIEEKYLNEVIQSEYESCINIRKQIIKGIYGKKELVSRMYDEIYTPIDSQLTSLLGEMKNEIKFKTKLVPETKSMVMSLQKFNRRPQSIFQGVADSEKAMLTIIEKTTWNDFESVYESLEKIIYAGFNNEFDKLEKIILNKEDLYNNILSLEYLNIDFQLTYQDSDLTELSPGERGLVLLTFYLALSKDNVPIIIDQPEDNLDNQSVYSKLVPCILKAKKSRQVIIVTHNPNIAIACDAEQIVVADMDKSTKEIRYTSGSVENALINSKIVEILEGTRPAFTLRESKYLTTITS